MNILFISNGGATSNSLIHVKAFARGLNTLGHHCTVSTPDGLAAFSDAELVYCSVIRHGESPSCTADIIHAWTPRMPVLDSLLQLLRKSTCTPRVIVHMEDNERHLLSHTAGSPFDQLVQNPERALTPLIIKGLAHPVRHQLFLAAADLITGIIPSLRAFAGNETPFALLYPCLDLKQFYQPNSGRLMRQKLGLALGQRVIVYPGGANLTNAEELRTLYSAAALLNKRGQSVKLIRTGPPTPWFTASLTSEEQACAIELGFVERATIPQLLAMADVLVQPGRPGPFNDYRLPSKIPEFLASGRPVILPATNIALEMIDGQEAVFLNQGTPEDIANCCERIFNDPTLANTLGIAGKAFAEKHFDASVNCKRLEKLYMEVLARPPAADWSRIRRWGHDEADLFPLGSGRATTENILELAQRRRNRWQHRIGELFGVIR